MTHDEQALKDKIRPIMEDLVFKLVSDKPECPTDYMINYLEKLGGFTSNGITLTEKKELEQLRKDILKYRQFEEEEKAQSEVNHHDQSLTEDEEDDIDDHIEKKVITAQARLSKQREGVSAEAYGIFNQKSEFTPKEIPKSDDQIQRIKTRVLQSFLFSALEAKDLSIVIGSMEEKRFEAGEYVIKQYESGDCLFIVESGELNCFRKIVSQ
jgi:cAMP-dependent protein kinase regulator